MKPNRVIKLPVFKTLIIPVARKEWKCNLCKERVEIGKRYTHYVNRRPHEIINYRFHNECFMMVMAYCNEKKRSTFTPQTVAKWIRSKCCDACGEQDCSIRECPKVKAVTKFSGNRKSHLTK